MCGKISVRCMSRVLFWLRRFRLAAQGWHPQGLVRPLLISPSIFLAEVSHSGSILLPWLPAQFPFCVMIPCPQCLPGVHHNKCLREHTGGIPVC